MAGEGTIEFLELGFDDCILLIFLIGPISMGALLVWKLFYWTDQNLTLITYLLLFSWLEGKK